MSLARFVDADLAPRPAGMLLGNVRAWVKLLGDYEAALRNRLITYLKEHGSPVEGGNELAIIDGDMKLRMYRTRKGFDAKKVEALLRAKDMDLAAGMDALITYKVNEERLKLAVERKFLTEAELETCRYDESWTVKNPERFE